jgi:polar amino acid transport system substrate-binding protein
MLSGWEAAWRYMPSLLRASLITLVLSGLSMALAVAFGVFIPAAGLRRQAHARAVGRLCGNHPRHAGSVAAVHSLLRHRRGRAPAGICCGASRSRLNYAAYESAIYRSALEAVPGGQLEAARVLGLGDLQVLALVRGPQALRLALAPITNDFVALLKDSSLVSVVAKFAFLWSFENRQHLEKAIRLAPPVLDAR